MIRVKTPQGEVELHRSVDVGSTGFALMKDPAGWSVSIIQNFSVDEAAAREYYEEVLAEAQAQLDELVKHLQKAAAKA